MKHFILIHIVLLFTSSNFAQVNSSWSVTINGEILWQEVTPLGDLLISTTKGMYGVNPASGEIKWELPELANISQNQFQNIPASTFSSVSKGNNFVILEPIEGLIVFNSAETDLAQVIQPYFLYNHNGILVSGKDKEGKDLIVMVGMNSGKSLWNLSDDFGRIIAVEEITQEEILLVNLFHVYKINSQSGDILWKNATSKEAATLNEMGALGDLFKSMAEEMTKDVEIDLHFYSLPERSRYYLGFTQKQEHTIGTNTSITYKNLYTAYDLYTGDMIWEEPYEMDGQVSKVILHENGLIILPDDGNRTKINLVDYDSKEGKWGKKGDGIPVKGGIYDYLEMKDGILLVSQSSDKNYLNFLDPELGLTTFDKPLRIDGRLVASMNVNKGVLFITDEQIDILDTKEGELLLDNQINTKPELTAQKGDHIYAFDLKNGLIKKIDIQAATITEVNTDKVKFEGNEDPENIELRENGIFVNSDQNVALVSYDGKMIFQEYYPSPREAAWKRALMYAQAIRASLISAQAYYTSGAMQAAAPSVREEDVVAGEIVGGLGQVYNDLGNVASNYAATAFRAAGARFKATSEGRDFQITLTQLKDKTIALAKINKNTGQIDDYIDLGKDKEPVYAVDDVFGTVFLKTAPSSVECYEF